MQENDSKQGYYEALKHNWEHLRHQEIQRQHQLYVYIVLFSAVLTFVVNGFTSLHATLQQFWPIFLFLSIYSYLVCSSVTKWNLEIKNFIKHIQWISEKLKLNQSISEERKQKINNKKLDCTNKESLLEDSMYQGYMGLALPLKKRVNKNFSTIIDLILFGTSTAFLSGLLIYVIDVLFKISPIIIFEFQLPFRVISYPIGLVLSVYITITNKRVRSKMEENTIKLLDVREPNEITMRWRNVRPFYEDIDEKHEYYK